MSNYVKVNMGTGYQTQIINYLSPRFRTAIVNDFLLFWKSGKDDRAFTASYNL